MTKKLPSENNDFLEKSDSQIVRQNRKAML